MVESLETSAFDVFRLQPPVEELGPFLASHPLPYTSQIVNSEDPRISSESSTSQNHDDDQILTTISVLSRATSRQIDSCRAKGRLIVRHGIAGKFESCTDERSLIDDQGNRIQIRQAIQGSATWQACRVTKGDANTIIAHDLDAFSGERLFSVVVSWSPNHSPTVTKRFEVKQGVRLRSLCREGEVEVNIPPNSATKAKREMTLTVSTTRGSAFDISCHGATTSAVSPELVSPILDCRPSGASFYSHNAVTITLPLVPYCETATEPCYGEVWTTEDEGESWSPLIDSAGKRVVPSIAQTANGQWTARFQTTHFSCFSVAFFNRIVDGLHLSILYRRSPQIDVKAYISPMMDMPDKNGVQKLGLYVELKNGEEELLQRRPLRMTGGSARVSLPYGILRFALQSEQLQPCEGDSFEKRVLFDKDDDYFPSVVFQCERTRGEGSDGEMIPIDEPLGSVTISRWNRESVSSDRIYLKKDLCKEEWSDFRETINTGKISSKIRSLRMVDKFRSVCTSRLSLKDSVDTDGDVMNQDDFVGEVAQLFEQKLGGTPEQLKTAIVESLQTEEITQMLDPKREEESTPSSTSTESVPSTHRSSETLSSHYLSSHRLGPAATTQFDSDTRRSIRGSRGSGVKLPTPMFRLPEPEPLIDIPALVRKRRSCSSMLDVPPSTTRSPSKGKGVQNERKTDRRSVLTAGFHPSSTPPRRRRENADSADQIPPFSRHVKREKENETSRSTSRFKATNCETAVMGGKNNQISQITNYHQHQHYHVHQTICTGNCQEANSTKDKKYEKQ